MVWAEIRRRAPALGEPEAGAPLGLPGGGGLPAAVGAPPVLALAVAARQSSSAIAAIVKRVPASQGRVVLPTTATLSFVRLRS